MECGYEPICQGAFSPTRPQGILPKVAPQVKRFCQGALGVGWVVLRLFYQPEQRGMSARARPRLALYKVTKPAEHAFATAKRALRANSANGAVMWADKDD